MKKFSIYSRTDSNSTVLSRRITTSLTAAGWKRDNDNPDVVIAIGGDGKILRAIHRYFDILDHVSFVAINTGTLGFLADYSRDEVDDLIQGIISEKPSYVEDCPILEITFHYKEGQETIDSVNEIRVEHPIRTMSIEVSIDDVLFEKFSGNGACVSSPIGSTGYVRSIGGSIIERTKEVLQFIEVAPIYNKKSHSLRSPLILEGNRKVSFVSNAFDGSYISTDYCSKRHSKIQKIDIKLADKKVRFIHYKPYNFFTHLEEKLV